MTGKPAAFSQYNSGFESGLVLKDHSLALAHPGKVFYVGDGDTAGNTAAVPNRKTPSDGNKGSFLAPFKTLDYAIGQCLADRGDIIYVLPGYVDTLVAANEIDVDVDGVTIIGLGKGDKQPLIQFDNTAATFEVNADNVTLAGLNFKASVHQTVLGVNVVAGSDDFHIHDCRFTADSLGTDEFNDALSISSSDRFIVENCYFDMDDGENAQSAIHLVGACLGGTIRNNYITGDYGVACIESITTAQEQLLIEHNTLVNGAHSGLNVLACISLLTGTSGFIQHNSLYTNVATAVTGAIVADGCFMINNQIASTAEAASLEAEVTEGQVVEVTMVDSVADENVSIFTIDGTVAIQALYGVCTTDGDGSEAVDLTTEASSVPASFAIWAASEIHTANAGDIISSTTVGGSVTVSAAAAHEGLVSWNSPLIITGTETLIDIGTPGSGAGLHTYVCVWEPLSSGAEVLSTKA